MPLGLGVHMVTALKRKHILKRLETKTGSCGSLGMTPAFYWVPVVPALHVYVAAVHQKWTHILHLVYATGLMKIGILSIFECTYFKDTYIQNAIHHLNKT